MTGTRRMCAWLAWAAVLLGLAVPAPAQVGRSLGVIDPNVAGESELLAVPLAADVVKEILASRPFAGMTALDALLARSLKAEERAAAYRKLFIAIDLNHAPREEILMIPGVGNRLLHEFQEYRPYKALAQFRREIGKYVDAQEVARLEQYVFVPLNLNTATDEDILTIPGVGKRMLHEFKEYRPYKSLEQFRREIGKYVDGKELARLERYVKVD
jgi:DNA uptake protein ComE-like DNA-binding protein